MKRYNDKKSVDFNNELQTMIDYVYQTWDGDKEILTQMVTEGFIAGYKAAENWIDRYGSIDFTESWMKERESFLEKDHKDNIYYDQIGKIPRNLMMHPMSYQDVIMKNWDFEKITQKVSREIKSNIPNIPNNILPKGWKAVKDSGDDAFSHFDTFSLKEENLFKGHNSDSAGSVGFHGRINLAHTFYDATEQGKNPIQTLISSSFAHGLTTREHNNKVELFKEVQKIKKLFNNEDFNTPTYLGDLTKLSNNKFFKALMIDKYDIQSKQEYSSQEEMNQYIKDINEKRNIYGFVEFNLLGSDDHWYEGYKIQKIYTFEHFQEQIKNNVKTWFGDNSYKTIYYSDNNFTEVKLNQVLESLSFKQISQKEFETFQKTFEKTGSVSYGFNEDFMTYNYPTKEDLIAMNASRLTDMLKSITTPNSSEKVSRDERDSLYEKKILDILGLNNTKQNKPK